MDTYTIVWVYIEDDWQKCKLLSNDQHKYIVGYNDEEIIVNNIFTANDDDTDNKNNLINIPHLNEPTILNSVYLRYNKNIIYTYTGKILISVNPFCDLGLYSDEIILNYKNNINKNPHIYQIANLAYYNLLESKKNQTILISGESGAGKTYGVRSIIKYLTRLSNRHSDIEQQVIDSNPILEAFGNAKTSRNSNSSRFGKFIKIQMNNGIIKGCKIDTYLLETIRIVHQNEEERNFHIFYQLLCNNVKNKYFLKDFTDYKYLNYRYINCYDINDTIEFENTIQSLKSMKFSEENIDYILRIVSSILHIGNIIEKECEEIDIVSKLLKIDKELLIDSLFYRYIQVNDERYKLELKDEANSAKNSLCANLYQKMFDFIVNKINDVLISDTSEFIGILDIFGFESFQINNFEQFCINYTNESLQEQFNKYIFKLEQIEYENEGIDWKNISFPDNKECLDIIEGKFGIIDMLNEECKLPKGNDINFTQKILKKFKGKYVFENKRYVNTRFNVNHYAGNIEYTTTNFCDKNKNIISNEINQLISNIKIFKGQYIKKISRIGSKTVGVCFRTQLNDLMKLISTTNPYYIRCIKPNDQNIKQKMDRYRVNEQLKYSGILEAIRVARSGYPIRFKKESFVEKYKLINGFDWLKNLENDRSDMYCIGKTKIFLKDLLYNELENKKNESIRSKMIIIQKYVRRYLLQKKYLSIKTHIIKIQSIFRMYICKKILKDLKINRSTIIIQKNIRSYLNVKKYYYIKNLIINIQKWYRNTKYTYRLKKIMEIQKWWKKIYNRNLLIKKNTYATIIQTYFKRYLKRKTNFVNIEKKLKNDLENSHKEREEQKRQLEQIKLEKETETKERRISQIQNKKLENEISMFKSSIDNNVKQKMKMATELEKLLLENDRIRRQMKRISQQKRNTDCIIS